MVSRHLLIVKCLNLWIYFSKRNFGVTISIDVIYFKEVFFTSEKFSLLCGFSFA